MIEERPNGVVELSYHDWCDDMKGLSEALSRLPARYDGQHERIHDLGIDRLSRIKHGKSVIQMMSELVPELVTCPDADEVMALGKLLLSVWVEVNGVCQEIRRERLSRMSRPWCGPTARFGFVRRN
jgi:hypothetical protein